MMWALRDMLAPERVSFESGIGSQKQAFERLGELLAPATGLPASRLAAAFAARERLGTTGFGGGVAIPHGRLEGAAADGGDGGGDGSGDGIGSGIGSGLAALLCLAQPVDWQAVDGQPVDLLVALATGSDDGAAHLQALALVGRTLRDRQLVEKLRGAADADALWAILDMAAKKAA